MDEIVHLINEMSPYLLLGFLLAGLMHVFIPGKYYTKYLSSNSFRSVVNAALFGIPLPLCSCGVIPTAMSLRKEGASKGAVGAFLIATPQTGVDSIIATFSLMGLPFAIIRPFAALVTAIFGGQMINVFGETDEVQSKREAAGDDSSVCNSEYRHEGFMHKISEAFEYAYIEMMEDIGKWLIIGLVVAGLITVFVPESLFQVFQGNTLASMLLVMAIALPMYLCATGSIPIAVALMMKGLTPGAALVLLMAGPACNFASMLVINKVLGRRTLATYLTSIIVGAVAFGFAIDYLQFHGVVDFLQNLAYEKQCCAEGDSWFSWTCTILLFLMLVNAILLPKLGLRKANHCHCGCEESDACHSGTSEVDHCQCSCSEGGEESAGEANGCVEVFIIEGMNCNHCRTNAEKAIAGVKGVRRVSVDLASRQARVEGTASFESLCEAVEALGFTLHYQS